MVDRSLSINQIRGWEAPSSELRSGLAQRHEAAVATPLRELNSAQIAMLVRQKTELEIVVPLAVELLSDDPLLVAFHYMGDLLAAVLGVPEGYWKSHPDVWYEVNSFLPAIDTAFEAIAENRGSFESALSQPGAQTQGS